MVPSAQDDVVSPAGEGWGSVLLSGPKVSEVIRRLSANDTHRTCAS